MTRWQKKGVLFCPDNKYPWMISHAANPFAVHKENDVYRVFFTCRDSSNRSFIGSVDIDFAAEPKVQHISEEPVIAPGEAGLFDDSGTAMGFYTEIERVPHIYYLGWNLKLTVPWLNTIGLARRNSAGKFEKVSRAPIMDRSDEDPFSISYPSILFENGVYKMWYGSNLAWGKQQHEMKHVIKYAQSKDGINWKRDHEVAVGLVHKNEYALSKPYVLKEKGTYRMWYSYRANDTIETYRIGYAESGDGKKWTRLDENAGIDVSKEGWDSEMICYPFVFEHKGKKIMLYNGNGYGKTGFGWAVATD